MKHTESSEVADPRDGDWGIRNWLALGAEGREESARLTGGFIFLRFKIKKDVDSSKRQASDAAPGRVLKLKGWKVKGS